MKALSPKAIALFIIISCSFLFVFSSCKKNTAIEAAAPNLEFVNFTTDNIDTVYNLPADSLIYHAGSGESSNFFKSIGVTAIHRNGIDSNFVVFNFSDAGIATGSSQQMGLVIRTGMEPLGMLTPVTMNITEYGAVGQYIAGNCNGQVVDMSGNNHNISISFRIKRNH